MPTCRLQKRKQKWQEKAPTDSRPWSLGAIGRVLTGARDNALPTWEFKREKRKR